MTQAAAQKCFAFATINSKLTKRNPQGWEVALHYVFSCHDDELIQIFQMEKTTKIQNDHADQKISVSGSEISSQSENMDEFKEQNYNQANQSNENYNDNKVMMEGAYEPGQYANLPVGADLKELFKSIQRYTPTILELDTRLKAFVPEYIPAIGEVDAFLKMPRPDNQPETLGLYVLDEPALNQSNRAKLDLELGAKGVKYTGGEKKKIHAIEEAEKKPKEIVTWINSVGDVHKDMQPPSVSYSKPMPDIDSLMQVWPAEVEELLEDVATPSEEIDLSLKDYSKVMCNLVDIPVHGSLPNAAVESLHVMFTLYSAFKENQHFQMNNENESYVENR